MNICEQRVQSIFFEALSRCPDEWPAFLSRTCDEDPALRQRLEALLAAHRRLRTIEFETSATATASADRTLLEDPGSQIGPYRLLKQIGEGGFGIVYLAEQEEPVRRRVALKVLKPGMDTRQVIARFEAERHVLALMDHVNIARVLDAGMVATAGFSASTLDHGDAPQATGRPYFVMELVNGVPITDYCAANSFSLSERLKLLIDVCRAVQHAHQKGIIHRDLKPSNVLVTQQDGAAVPKVIDFGIAKATREQLTDKTLFTGLGQWIGTPLYMSPEQAALSAVDVDTRSDVYSLGVLLYELLTGTTPLVKERLQKSGVDEIRRLIRDEEPPAPSARVKLVEPSLVPVGLWLAPRRMKELDWIVMRALEKDRKRRYESASALANDLQRYLADEPVEAGPPSRRYRLQKFARRNRGPVLAAALVLLALLTGLVGTSWGLLRAEDARRLAEAGEQKAKSAEQIAKTAAAAEKKAHELAQQREAETTSVLQFVEKRIIGAARPDGQFDGLGHDVMLRSALESSLGFIEKDFDGQPLTQARLRHQMGVSFKLLGDGKIALEQDQQALALYRQYLGEEHPDTLRCTGAVVNDCPRTGRHAEGAELGEQALPLAVRVLGADHAETLGIRHNLANCYIGLRRHHDALRLIEENVSLKLARFGNESYEAKKSLGMLGFCYSQLGRHAEALQAYEVSLTQNRAAHGPQHPDSIWSLARLAEAHAALEHTSEAIALREELLPLERNAFGKLATQARGTTTALVKNYFAAGRPEDALKLQAENLTLHKQILGTEHADTWALMKSMADRYTALERPAEAIPLCEELLALQRAKLGDDHKDTVSSMISLAEPHQALGHIAEAIALREELLPLARNAFGKLSAQARTTTTALVQNYFAAGRPEDALKLQGDNLALHKQLLGANHGGTWASMKFLADRYTDLKRPAEAIPFREELLALQRAKLGDDHKDTVSSMIRLADDYVACGRYEDALPWRERIVAIRKASPSAAEPTSLVSMYKLAWTYDRLGRDAQTIQVYGDLLSMNNGQLEPKPLALYLNNCAWRLSVCPDSGLRDPQRSCRLAAQAIELQPQEAGYWNTLGAAQYRAGLLDEALNSLNRSVELQPEANTWDWLLLAMVHSQLGNQDSAHCYYQLVQVGWEETLAKDPALRSIHAEAAVLLGINQEQEKVQQLEQ